MDKSREIKTFKAKHNELLHFNVQKCIFLLNLKDLRVHLCIQSLSIGRLYAGQASGGAENIQTNIYLSSTIATFRGGVYVFL